MIDKKVYNERIESYCKKCEFWHQGRCRKGHLPSSAAGCPIKKFPPINGADYSPDQTPWEVEEPVNNCYGCSRTMQDLTWTQVVAQFTKAMAQWSKAGFPVVPPAIHGQRQSKCAICPHKKGYWCELCKCLIYLKTKVATVSCPDNPPRWRSY